MKTKVLLMSAVAALTVYSCSTDRDEQLNENPAETAKVEKLELKKLKPINKEDSTQYRTASDSSKLPEPIAYPANGSGTGIEPNPDINPNPDDPELIPPGDIRPPKGGK